MARPPHYLAAHYPPVCLTNRREGTGADERIRLRREAQDRARMVLRGERPTGAPFKLSAWMASYLLPKAEFDTIMNDLAKEA